MKVKCPFFRKQCVREQCSAFVPDKTYSHTSHDYAKEPEWTKEEDGSWYKMQYWCAALKIYLPYIRKG